MSIDTAELEIIVNGYVITDQELLMKIMGCKNPIKGYTVEVDGDEIWKDTLEEAIEFARSVETRW